MSITNTDSAWLVFLINSEGSASSSQMLFKLSYWSTERFSASAWPSPSVITVSSASLSLNSTNSWAQKSIWTLSRFHDAYLKECVMNFRTATSPQKLNPLSNYCSLIRIHIKTFLDRFDHIETDIYPTSRIWPSHINYNPQKKTVLFYYRIRTFDIHVYYKCFLLLGRTFKIFNAFYTKTKTIITLSVRWRNTDVRRKWIRQRKQVTY